MKIKQIRRTAPELYLVTYTTRWTRREVQRYVTHIHRSGNVFFGKEPMELFFFRDTGEIVENDTPLEWMIRNDVDFFDNTAVRQGCKIVVEDSGTFINPIPDEPTGITCDQCYQNGRRERDQELTPLTQYACRFTDDLTNGIDINLEGRRKDLIKIISELPPLNPPEPT